MDDAVADPDSRGRTGSRHAARGAYRGGVRMTAREASVMFGKKVGSGIRVLAASSNDAAGLTRAHQGDGQGSGGIGKGTPAQA